MIREKNNIAQTFSAIATGLACLAYSQLSVADPVNEVLSAYMLCIQENASITPAAETEALRVSCQKSYDTLNSLFPTEIASMIIEQAEMDARQ